MRRPSPQQVQKVLLGLSFALALVARVLVELEEKEEA